MISLTRSAEFWPNIDIKRRIRRVFNQRILRFISKFGHNLKPSRRSQPQVNSILLIFSLLLASSTGDQYTLGEYCEDSDLVKNEPTAEKEKNASDVEYCVIPYTRVSSDEQEKNGRSIDSQQEEISSIVENNSKIGYYTEFIEDKGESGTNFNRQGIQRVAKLAREPDVTHIIVDTIDRIGRNVSKTLMFIENMRDKHDVKILQRESEFDILNPEDKMVLNHKVMIAEFSTQNRARSSKRSSADNFIENKQWCSWYRWERFGYKLENEKGTDAESKGWLEKVDGMGPIIEDIFSKFIEERGYKPVKEFLNDNHAEEIREYKNSRLKHRDHDGSEDDKIGPTEEPMKKGDIKPIITDPVYKGEPMIPVSEFSHYDSEPVVQDSNLEFIDENMFTKAQEIVADISDKYSTNADNILDPDEYFDEFNPFAIETVCPQAKLVCPKCTAELNFDGGIRTISGKYSTRIYECTNDDCDYSDRWPKAEQKDRIELLTQMEEYGMIT